MARSATRPRSITYLLPSSSRSSLPSAISVPTPVLVKKAGMPAPPARMRSARVLQFAGQVLLGEGFVLAHIGRDHLFVLAGIEQDAQAHTVDTSVVGDDAEVLHARVANSLDHGFGDAAQAEAPGHDGHAIP